MNLFFCRIPVFDIGRNTVGYHLESANTVAEQRGTPDEYADEEALFKQNYPVLFKEKMAFIRFNKDLMMKNIPWRLPSTNLYIEVTANMLTDREILEKCFQLKRNGYNIVLVDAAYDQSYDELFRFATIVKLDVTTDHADIDKTIEYCGRFGKQVLLYNVNSQEQYEYAAESGCDYIEGFFFSYPVLQSKQSGGPMIRTFLQILAMVYSPEPNIEHIATLISTDPVLTIRLLKQINTVFEGKYNRVSSVLQALVMLGLDKIKQWVYLVGLQRLNRDAPSEVLKTALFRGSFCERVCRISPGLGSKASEMYLMGLISVITGINENVEKALDDLPVSEEIRQGLCGEEGDYGNIYKLAFAFERADWDTVDEYVEKLGVDTGALADQYLISVKFANGFTKLG